MAKIDLTKYGITGTTEIVYNPSYETLFEEETKPELEGFEKGQVSELGAVNVMTGIYTGRSPKDKYIVMDENSKDTVWWTSDEYKNDNHPATQEAWNAVKDLAKKELSNKKLFVVDAFCGANKDTRMAIRFIVEVAWQAHFVTNMFIQPTAEELENFEPDFVVYNASKAKVENYKELGLNSETAVMFNITSREQVIVNTWYGGEMKKGMFSMMNYYLPLKGIASMHCSANTDKEGKNTAIFFGLSGTGKTTLSTDPKRLLIGDDEHGWDDNGVFNFEGGCYAKTIRLSREAEPEIFSTTERFGTVLENGLDGELESELGYSKYDYRNKDTDNSRNGYSEKTLKTSYGDVDIQVPRDRKGEFEPELVKKQQTTLTGDIEEKILSMYAKGMTTGDIETHIQDIYGISVSDSTVSRITDKILPIVRDVLSNMVRDGLDKTLLTGALNRTEFILREADFVGRPKGLIYGIRCMDTWLYDMDPLAALSYEGALETLRRGIDNGYFEGLIQKYILDNPYYALVSLVPEPGLTERHDKALADKLAAYKASLSKEEIEKL